MTNFLFERVGTIVYGNNIYDNDNIRWLREALRPCNTTSTSHKIFDYTITIDMANLTDKIKVHFNNCLVVEFIIDYILYSHATSVTIRKRVHDNKLEKEFMFFAKLAS